jgi:hypothetical protein
MTMSRSRRSSVSRCATARIVENGAVKGVRFRQEDGNVQELRAESVILGAGGFESNPAWRREHLGEGWENAKVRGTPFNTGEMLAAALEAGAEASRLLPHPVAPAVHRCRAMDQYSSIS